MIEPPDPRGVRERAQALELREQLAALAHEQWSGWMRYLFSKGCYTDMGDYVIPKSSVLWWQRQMGTPYADLSEVEKDSDRKEADRVLALLASPWPGAWPPRLWACNFCGTVAGWPSESGMHGGGCKGDIVELSDWAVADHLRCHGNWPKVPLPPTPEREDLSDFPKCSGCGAAIWIEHAVDCPLVNIVPQPGGPGAWQPMELVREMRADAEDANTRGYLETWAAIHGWATAIENKFKPLPPAPDHETGTP